MDLKSDLTTNQQVDSVVLILMPYTCTDSTLICAWIFGCYIGQKQIVVFSKSGNTREIVEQWQFLAFVLPYNAFFKLANLFKATVKKLI